MFEDSNNRLPLGLCKQAFMKLESFIMDIHEIQQDPDLTTDERYEFSQMVEVSSILGVRLLNIVKKECNEEDFINEDIALDEMDMYPEQVVYDILDDDIK